MAYLCLIAYVTAIYIRPTEVFAGWAGFPFVEILAGITVAVAATSYLAKPRKFWDLPHDKFVLGIWFAIAVSNLAWGWFGGAFFGFVDFFKIAFYYFLIRFAIRDVRQFEGFIRTIVALTVLLAVSGIVQFYTGSGLGGVPLEDGRIKGIGIFNDPNDLALTLTLALPFMLERPTTSARRPARRIISAILLAIVIVAILYTNSRGGMLGLGLILSVHLYRRFGRGTAVVAAVVLLAAGLAWGPSRLSMISPSEESAQERIQAWGVALQLFKSHPLFGIGYNRFTDFHERVAHNSFVHTLVELGLLGCFFWVGMCYWLVKSLLPKRANDAGLEIERWRAPVLLSAAAVLLGCVFLSRQYAVILYTIVGIGACHASMARAHGAAIETRTSTRDVLWIFALTVTGIAMTYVAVRLFARWSGA